MWTCRYDKRKPQWMSSPVVAADFLAHGCWRYPHQHTLSHTSSQSIEVRTGGDGLRTQVVSFWPGGSRFDPQKSKESLHSLSWYSPLALRWRLCLFWGDQSWKDLNPISRDITVKGAALFTVAQRSTANLQSTKSIQSRIFALTHNSFYYFIYLLRVKVIHDSLLVDNWIVTRIDNTTWNEYAATISLIVSHS